MEMAQAITYLEYDGREIKTKINGVGNLPEFQVVKINKK